MGVIYKLKDEVVQFIISQRQSNPLSSCRQLAESASEKFSLHLSKSSVHDVLKESGITTPRGRKPRPKFEIPQEKKKQIQDSFSQVKLLPNLVEPEHALLAPPVILPLKEEKKETFVLPQKIEYEKSAEYEGAGGIFLKAALWDLGIYSVENIKETDWNYYLTYSKGVKVVLENDKSVFIDLRLPIERCIRETADGLINNVKPFIVSNISDEMMFKACMDAQEGYKIHNISIVDQRDHILLEIGIIMESKRNYLFNNRMFVENNEKNQLERTKSLFFSQYIDNNDVINNILSLKGFDSINKDEIVVNLLIEGTYNNKIAIEQAAEILNGMYLRDEQDRLVKIMLQFS